MNFRGLDLNLLVAMDAHARELAKPLLHGARAQLSALEREILINSGRSAESTDTFEETL